MSLTSLEQKNTTKQKNQPASIFYPRSFSLHSRAQNLLHNHTHLQQREGKWNHWTDCSFWTQWQHEGHFNSRSWSRRHWALMVRRDSKYDRFNYSQGRGGLTHNNMKCALTGDQRNSQNDVNKHHFAGSVDQKCPACRSQTWFGFILCKPLVLVCTTTLQGNKKLIVTELRESICCFDVCRRIKYRSHNKRTF